MKKLIFGLTYKKNLRIWSRIFLWSLLFLILFFVVLRRHLPKDMLPQDLKSAIREYAVLKPEFFSLAQRGEPYLIKAKHVKQKSPETFLFSDPIGQLDKEENAYYLKSFFGFYNHGIFLLHLFGNVQLWDKKNYNIRTQDAFVDLKKKKSFGKHLVKGHGPIGQFNGTGFMLENDFLTINGPARVIIKGESLK